MPLPNFQGWVRNMRQRLEPEGKAASGAGVTRHFCPDCGVHLFAHNNTDPQFRSIKICSTTNVPGLGVR